MAVKYEDQDYAIYPKTGGSRGFVFDEGEYEGRAHKDISGIVETPYGFVKVYASYWKGSYSRSMIEIIKDGRNHTRHLDKALSSRGLVTKAKQFAKEVFDSK